MYRGTGITLLAFPVDMDASGRFLAVASALGIRIIGASSAADPPVDAPVDELIHLPYITDPDFIPAFKTCLEAFRISHIHTAHPGVWTVLNELLRKQAGDYRFTLCQPSPYQSIWQDTGAGYAWADAILADPFSQRILPEAGTLKLALNPAQYAGLYKQFLQIPGQCDLQKLTAFAHLARILPVGDLVEIGSLAGRSAFALAWLAQRYGIGTLISIDPWSNQAIAEQGREADILNRDLESIDFEKIFLAYISNLSLLSNAAYIRAVSTEAIAGYRQAASEGVLQSPQLGSLPVAGEISLLHVDANHEYNHVRQDLETWEPYVKPGGWVLLDDYHWAFGDGPKRAGDELLASGRFDHTFTLGDTLYLRKG
ncbi:MAG: class I SAM-dependent methyltransferase [Candidatus Thiodiazotropha sp.]